MVVANVLVVEVPGDGVGGICGLVRILGYGDDACVTGDNRCGTCGAGSCGRIIGDSCDLVLLIGADSGGS